MPEIEIIKGEGTTLVRTEKDFSKLSPTERKSVIKSYFPELSIEEKVLIRLLERNATPETGSVSIKKDKTFKSLLKSGIIKETGDGRTYLSDFGYRMAKGAKDVYG